METPRWELWFLRPQTLWVRRAVFQVHLWSGICLGLYVFIVSVSGSAIVFRAEIYDRLEAKRRVTVSGKRLTQEELKQAARRAYPNYAVGSISPGLDAADAAEVLLVRGGNQKRRLFDPYTGKDVGPGLSGVYGWMSWLGDIHGNLLLGPAGLVANGIGGFLVAVLGLTGLTVWWPGIANWRRSMAVRRKVGWKRFNWDLHSATGFWMFGFLLMWGLTGAYFVFPDPFRAVINVFTPIFPPATQPGALPPQTFAGQGPLAGPSIAGSKGAPAPFRRIRRPLTRGQKILRGFSAAHYGTFGGWPVKVLWTVLGLAPPILFVSGLLMWWNRVLAPAARRYMRGPSAAMPEPMAASSGSATNRFR